MAGATVATNTGRAAGSRVGVALYQTSGILVNGAVAAVLTLIGIAVVAKYVRPREIEDTSAAARPVTEM